MLYIYLTELTGLTGLVTRTGLADSLIHECVKSAASYSGTDYVTLDLRLRSAAQSRQKRVKLPGLFVDSLGFLS